MTDWEPHWLREGRSRERKEKGGWQEEAKLKAGTEKCGRGMKRPLESERDGKERVGGRKRGLSKRGREGIKGRPPHFYVLSVLVSDTRRQGEESRGNIYQMHPCVMHGQGY